MKLDYFFTNFVKSPKFSEVIFKKHNLKVYENYVQRNLTRCHLTVVSAREFIMICLGSLERDYSLFRGVITLDKG